MPALQVRDFPDDLYEQLKGVCGQPASQHRAADHRGGGADAGGRRRAALLGRA